MAKKTNRIVIRLACQNKKDNGAVCKEQNYITSKNKKTQTDRIVSKKYCKFCKQVTEHKEVK